MYNIIMYIYIYMLGVSTLFVVISLFVNGKPRLIGWGFPWEDPRWGGVVVDTLTTNGFLKGGNDDTLHFIRFGDLERPYFQRKPYNCIDLSLFSIYIYTTFALVHPRALLHRLPILVWRYPSKILENPELEMKNKQIPSSSQTWLAGKSLICGPLNGKRLYCRFPRIPRG